MMSLWDALRMNMMISYQELVRTFLNYNSGSSLRCFCSNVPKQIAIKEIFELVW